MKNTKNWRSETLAHFDQEQAEALAALRGCTSFCLVALSEDGAVEVHWSGPLLQRERLIGFVTESADLI